MYSTNWLPIVRMGFIMLPLSWKIIEMLRPLMSRHIFGVFSSMFTPENMISPSFTRPSWGRQPKTARMTLVLPLPLSPTSDNTSPESREKLMPCTISVPAYWIWRFLTSRSISFFLSPHFAGRILFVTQ